MQLDLRSEAVMDEPKGIQGEDDANRVGRGNVPTHLETPDGQGFGRPTLSAERRVRPWLAVTLGLAGLLCVAVVALAAVFGPRLVRQASEAAREVTEPVTGYYDAVEAGDFERARGYLGSELRRENSVEELRAAWRRRVAAYGEPEEFRVTGTRVQSNTATGTTGTITGVLRYDSGQEEQKVIPLVREDGAWRLAALP